MNVPASGSCLSIWLATLIVTATAVADARLVSETTDPGPVHIPVRDGRLVGAFEVPRDSGRHAAIVVVGGSEGRYPERDARLFAEHGYAALALGYFRGEGLPNTLELVPVETVTRAVDWLAKRPEVDAERIGIVGSSKGSELALLAAVRDPRIRAVAVVAPSAYVWFGLPLGRMPDRSSWTWDGVPVPFIPPDRDAGIAVGQAFAIGKNVAFRQMYDASIASASAALRQDAAIPVERIAGPLLCVAGDADQEWDSAGACAMIEARRNAGAVRAGDIVAIEPGAGHALSFAGDRAPVSVPYGPITIQLGGTVAANLRGGADAFQRAVDFFRRTLGAARSVSARCDLAVQLQAVPDGPRRRNGGRMRRNCEP